MKTSLMSNALMLAAALLFIGAHAASAVSAQFVQDSVQTGVWWQASDGQFQNFTGGPPSDVACGQVFDINVTFQVAGNSGSNPNITSDTTSVDNQEQKSTLALDSAYILANNQYVSENPDGSGTDYLSDFQDMYLGTFSAPPVGDPGIVKINQVSTFPVYTTLVSTYVDTSNPWMVETMNGHWNVAITKRNVGLQVSAQPDAQYRAWFTSSAPAQITVQVPED